MRRTGAKYAWQPIKGGKPRNTLQQDARPTFLILDSFSSMLIHTKGCSGSDWKSKLSIPWAVGCFQVALNVTGRQADLVVRVYMLHFFKAAAGKSKLIETPSTNIIHEKINIFALEVAVFYLREWFSILKNKIAEDAHVPSSFTRGQPLLSLLKSVYLSGFCFSLQDFTRLSGSFGVGSQHTCPPQPCTYANIYRALHLKASGLWSLRLAQGKVGVKVAPVQSEARKCWKK